VELVTAIRGHHLEKGTTPRIDVENHAHRTLNGREEAVLALIAFGFTTREIAARLAFGAKTVENVKSRILVKLGVQNQAHAVAVALRNGALDLRGRSRQRVDMAEGA
jgi:DNA-binding NarL/FixJ family response regulator